MNRFTQRFNAEMNIHICSYHWLELAIPIGRLGMEGIPILSMRGQKPMYFSTSCWGVVPQQFCF